MQGTTKTNLTTATCDTCGKRFRVRDGNKSYRCPSCGGRVSCRPDSPTPKARAGAGAPERPDDSPGTTESWKKDPAARRAIMQKFARAKSTIRLLRTFYVARLALHGAMLAVLTPAFLGGLRGGSAQSFALVVSALISAVIYLFGTLRTPKRPVLCGVLLSAYESLILLSILIDFSFGFLGALLRIAYLFWVLALWFVTAQVVRDDRFRRANPSPWRWAQSRFEASRRRRAQAF